MEANCQMNRFASSAHKNFPVDTRKRDNIFDIALPFIIFIILSTWGWAYFKLARFFQRRNTRQNNTFDYCKIVSNIIIIYKNWKFNVFVIWEKVICKFVTLHIIIAYEYMSYELLLLLSKWKLKQKIFLLLCL